MPQMEFSRGSGQSWQLQVAQADHQPDGRWEQLTRVQVNDVECGRDTELADHGYHSPPDTNGWEKKIYIMVNLRQKL